MPSLFAQRSLLFTQSLASASPLIPAASNKRCHSSSRDNVSEKAHCGGCAKYFNLTVLVTTPKKNVSRATPILNDIGFIATPLSTDDVRLRTLTEKVAEDQS